MPDRQGERHVLVRLDYPTYTELRQLAEAEGLSAAEVLRQGLHRHLEARRLDGELPEPDVARSKREHPSARPRE